MSNLAESQKDNQARRAAREANVELGRVLVRHAAGKADIHDVRAARRDAQYWNQVVNSINGYL